MRRRRAFTLIEVLVVVAIISLLVSILMPSLAKAREQARQVVCAARMQQISRAESAYESTNGGWFVGSPLTTGYFLARNNTWNPSLQGFYRFAVEWFDFATPLIREMRGPSAVPNPNGDPNSDARKKMFLKVTEEPFHCPSNNEVTPAWPSSTGFPVIRAPSYLSMSTIMRGGPDMYARAGSAFPKVEPYKVAQSPAWELKPPDPYMPRAERIGRPSMKVFIADGLRFYDGTQMDYSTYPTGHKGMMCGDPPSAYSTDLTEAREYMLARQYSYRHGRNNRINAVFFDGHVESLFADAKSGPDKPYTGTAVHPRHYYPSNTVINDSSKLHVRIEKGTKLP